MNNPSPPNSGLFSAIERISEYPGQPLNEKYHKKMLQQLQAYHNTAKSNKEFSLVSSLEVLSKFVVTDFWLTTNFDNTSRLETSENSLFDLAVL